MIHLLRHAHAGKRGSHDPDADRPLSDRGRLQAVRIAERLLPHGPATIFTSPYLRCAQTAEIVSRTTGARVVPETALIERRPPGPILELITSGDAIVVCSHGDVLEAVLAALGIPGEDGYPRIAKGGCWDLVLDDRGVAEATYHPPPA